MAAKYLMGIHKPKIVFHEHVPVLSIDVFTRLMFHRIDAYIAVLKSMCAWANERKVSANKIYYLPNIASPPAAPVKYSSARSKKIMMAGNIWSFKNQTFAVDLLKHLDEDYTLDIYGGINDRKYYDTLTNLITEHNLHSRVNIIQGINDIYSIIGNYDFAIHTSTQETGPLVLLEYMHAELPFLTYATGDVVSYIAPRLPEFIMHTFSVHDWAERINNIMTNEDTLNNARHAMRCIINERCSSDAYYTTLSNVYEATLTKAKQVNFQS
jgi:glycosyltransferase involved in cell wall biosynthesis